MRVALAALESRAGDVAGNLARLTEAVEEHAGWGVDVLCCGEMFAHGFGGATFDPAHDEGLAWRLDGPEIGRLRKLARRAEMALCVGYFERGDLGFHSSAVVLGRDGATLANHRRISRGRRHGGEDPTRHREGSDPVAFQLAGKRCTVALCGDLWDTPATFAAVKPDVVFWPVHVRWSGEQWATKQVAAYAEQANRVYAHVLLTNNVTREGVDDAVGGAAWFHHGTVKAASGFDGEPAVTVIDIR